MRTTRTRLATTLLAGVLATAGLAACGSNDAASGSTSGGGGSSASPSAASTKPVATVADLSAHGGTTSVTLDPTFLKGLTTLQLTPSPLGTATIDGAVASFPITGGSVTVYTPGSVTPYVQGSVEHTGSGLQLVGGGKTVQLTDFVIDPGTSVLTGKVTVDGQVAYPSAPLFFLDGRTLQPLKTEGTAAVLEGTTVSLTKEAAAALDQVFGTQALTEYFPVGVAKISVNTQ